MALKRLGGVVWYKMSDGEEEKMVNGLSGDELAGEEGDDTVVGETVVGNVVNGIDQSGWSSDEEITPDEEAGAAGGYVLLPSSEDDVIADAEELNEQEEREETPNSPPEETINRILPAPEIQQPTVDMEDCKLIINKTRALIFP